MAYIASSHHYQCFYPAGSADAERAVWVIRKVFQNKVIECFPLDEDEYTSGNVGPIDKPMVVLFVKPPAPMESTTRFYFNHHARPRPRNELDGLRPNWHYESYTVSNATDNIYMIEKEWTDGIDPMTETPVSDTSIATLVWDYFFGLTPKPPELLHNGPES